MLLCFPLMTLAQQTVGLFSNQPSSYNGYTLFNSLGSTNTNMNNFHANNNPNLFCVDVDDVAWSTANWTNIGAQTYFSTNCQAPPTTYVPDNNFEAYLENNGMGNGIPYDSSVFTSAIDTLTYLDVSMGAGSATGIFDLTGIEDFTALTYLDCSYNQFTIFDVSQNTALTTLYCHSNQLTTLDVSQNTVLTKLDCGDAQLTSIDVSQNTALTTLYCYSNQLTTLDVSQNTVLTKLDCGDAQLTSIDLSQNTALIDLWCGLNLLTNLDVSQNIALTFLSCNQNLFTILDVSQNTALTYLDCWQNELTSLDLRNGNNTALDIYTQNNPNLFCIDVDNPVWSTANWTVANGTIDPQHYFSNNCSSVPFDCTDSLEVTDVIIDNGALTMNIAIYNGYNSYLSMPYVAFTIDANGDTIQQGNMNLFGAINLDTSWYNYSINSAINPSYPLTMYFVYVVSIGGSVTDTCILTYSSTPTDITDINASGNRKIISIVDVLGRETKGTKNEPLFYIYNDGTVEKRIVIE
jgi:hypothetical protein